MNRNYSIRMMWFLVLMTATAGLPVHAQFQELPEEYPVEESIPDVDDRPIDVAAISEKKRPPATLRRLDDTSWLESTEGLNYAERSQENSASAPPVSPTPPEFLNWILYAVLAVLLVGLLFLLVKRLVPLSGGPKNTTAAEDPDTIRDIEALDLETMLRQAVQRGEFSEVIRLHFLLVVQDLARTGQIEWRPEKTNRDYERELESDDASRQTFGQLAAVFERARYGDAPVEAPDVDRLAPRFLLFRQTLRPKSLPA